jgi:aspartate/methionine/tyrosine aminotransferase
MFSQRTGWNLAANRFAMAAERRRASGERLLDLTASNPTQAGFRYQKAAILKALAQAKALEYHPEARGLAVAREAVCGYYRERGESVEASRIVLTTSTSEGYSFAFRLLCDPGDEVLVPAPSYPLLEFLAGIQDVRLVPYCLFYDHGWHMDVRGLAEKVSRRTRALAVVHPNNPTGSFVKPGEADELAAVCAEHGLALIADEVFLDFALPGRGGRSFVAEERMLTLTLSGLSKIAGLPQMKFSWMVAGGPEEMVREALARLEVIADTYLSVSTPMQLAAPVLLKTRHGFQKQIMGRIRSNLAELDRQLGGQSLCSRLEMEGGWYAVLRVPVTGTDEELAIRLLEEEGVLIHPGHFYDFGSEGYLVASLMTEEETFREGVRRLLGRLAS